MLSHKNIIANVSAVMYQMVGTGDGCDECYCLDTVSRLQMEHTIRMDDILMSYLPLAHMFERCCEVGSGLDLCSNTDLQLVS